MIPILYTSTETNFNTYGIGALSDAVSCVVTEERNGQYECLLQYPISGKLYSEIAAERIIKVKSHPIGNPQLFRIYRISKPLRGIVTIYAQHISYDLSGIPVAPFSTSYTATAAMAYLFTGTAFSGSSDKSGSQIVACTTPKSIRAMLGGTEGSLLDLWGGEFRWDNFTVYLNTNRGSDKDVIIEYGKNLTDLLADHDLTEVYSELLPYATYTDSSGTVHTVMGTAQSITSVITRQKTLIKDFTYILGLDPEVVPTTNQINTAAQSWLSDNPLGYETPSLTVSFVEGEHGPHYPESAARIDLCDTVTIRYTALGVNVKAKVVKTEYDSLLEKYKRLTIGKPRANMADTVAAMQDEVTEVKTYPTRWSDAIALATQLITGNTGGYVILHEGPDGKPYELLIMDNPDINAAQNVWRWNVNGLGFSSSGYAGPYSTAITSNGMIVADFIQTGEIQDALGNNSWNLGTGVLTINNGKIQATYTHTYEYSDYSSSDISRITSIILHQVTPTDSDFEKYDIEGDGQIGPNDRNRIQQMINTSTSITKTITTTIDPSQNNKAISINIVVPAVGTAAAVNRTSFFAASQAKVNTVTCSNLDALNASVGAFCQGDAGAAKCINGADDYLEATDGTYTSKFASQLIRVATSGGDSSTIYRNGVVVTDTIKSLTYGLTGITFNDSYTTPKLYVIQRTQNSAGSQGVHLSEDGIYLAIVTRNNSSSASDTGVYVLQVRTSGNSSIREVVASSSTTLSISGDTLTFTTTNTYKTLTLIHITG